MKSKIDNEIFEHAKAISDYLKKSANPYVTIEITDSGIKMTSVDQFTPTTEVGMIRHDYTDVSCLSATERSLENPNS